MTSDISDWQAGIVYINTHVWQNNGWGIGQKRDHFASLVSWRDSRDLGISWLGLGKGARFIPIPIWWPGVRVLKSGGRVRVTEGAKRGAVLGI